MLNRSVIADSTHSATLGWSATLPGTVFPSRYMLDPLKAVPWGTDIKAQLCKTGSARRICNFPSAS